MQPFAHYHAQRNAQLLPQPLSLVHGKRAKRDPGFTPGNPEVFQTTPVPSSAFTSLPTRRNSTALYTEPVISPAITALRNCSRNASPTGQFQACKGTSSRHSGKQFGSL